MASNPTKPADGSERVSVTLPTVLAQRLRTTARANERPVSAIVRAALESYLAGQPQPDDPSFRGIGRSGLTDLSERVENIMLGTA